MSESLPSEPTVESTPFSFHELQAVIDRFATNQTGYTRDVQDQLRDGLGEYQKILRDDPSNQMAMQMLRDINRILAIALIAPKIE